jgi:hypothetical protein
VYTGNSVQADLIPAGLPYQALGRFSCYNWNPMEPAAAQFFHNPDHQDEHKALRIARLYGLLKYAYLY